MQVLHGVAELVPCVTVMPGLVAAEDSKLAGGVRTSSRVPVQQPRIGVKLDELTDAKFSKILFVTHLYPLEL